MLQNPSKYHANPLSHFLALHNTQASAHIHGHGHGHGHGHAQGGVGVGVVGAGVGQPHGLPTAALAAAAAAAAVTAGQSSYQMEQQQQQHTHSTQQQQQPAHAHSHTHAHIQASNHPQQQQQQQQHQQQQQQGAAATATSHAHLIEAAAAHTSLDVGKSFTIAAILGLQQSAIESQRKEYNKEFNNAINLSLNGGGADVIDHENNNNNNSKCYSNYNNNNIQNVNNFNCDSNQSLVNRYAHQTHPRANFAAAAAVAAAAAAGAAPSALQSLQQLHQHHAQQATLSYQREKLKSESHKKSALKNKRVRTIFTPEQLERLEAEFERQQYMVGPERLYLAHTLQLTEAQVKVWFQNRRIKWRKHHLELTQQRLALIRQSQLPSAAAAVASGVVPDLSITAQSPSLEENEDSKHSLRPLSRAARSESDLSICNDSLDGGDSLMDGASEEA